MLITVDASKEELILCEGGGEWLNWDSPSEIILTKPQNIWFSCDYF